MNRIFAGVLLLASTGGCGGELAVSLGDGGADGGSTEIPVGQIEGGEIQFAVSPPPGVALDALSWTLSGDAQGYTGALGIVGALAPGAPISFVAGGIQSGDYVVSMSGSDDDGVPCRAALPVSVTVEAGAVSLARVELECGDPQVDAPAPPVVESGIDVDASVTRVPPSTYVCPAITSVSVDPAYLTRPAHASLAVAIAHELTGGVTTYHWSATCPSGTPFITDPSSPNPTFTCGVDGAGVCTVSVWAGLDAFGADGGTTVDVCSGKPFEQVSVEVLCEPGADASAR